MFSKVKPKLETLLSHFLFRLLFRFFSALRSHTKLILKKKNNNKNKNKNWYVWKENEKVSETAAKPNIWRVEGGGGATMVLTSPAERQYRIASTQCVSSSIKLPLCQILLFSPLYSLSARRERKIWRPNRIWRSEIIKKERLFLFLSWFVWLVIDLT